MLAAEGDGAQTELRTSAHCNLQVGDFLLIHELQTVEFHLDTLLDDEFDIVAVGTRDIAVVGIDSEQRPVLVVAQHHSGGSV